MNYNYNNNKKDYIINKRKNSFRIQDLENGDIVLFNDGDVEIAMPSIGTFICEDGYDKISDFTEDLKYIYDTSLMIMEIRRPTQSFECNFSAFRNNYGIVVYKRDEEGKNKVEKQFNNIDFTKEDYLKINNYIQEKNNSETFENKILSLINKASNEEIKSIVYNVNNWIIEKSNVTKIYCTT